MVLFTPKKLTFKESKKQHQILAQTAYYQAGKIVVQTILPEQPPVALITLNTLGTTCSTSADTYIPIENIFNTQSCSSLESRLVSLYGGKAASLLIEYEQRLRFLNKNNDSFFNDSSNDSSFAAPCAIAREKIIPFNNSEPNKEGLTKQRSPSTGAILFRYPLPLTGFASHGVRGQKLTKQKIGKRSKAGTETKLINNVQSQTFDFSELTKKWKPNGKARLVRTCFAGAGNNIFQSTLGNIEIQIATRLARIMINYWNFYSLNKISLYSLFLFKKYAPAHNSFGVPLNRKASINSVNFSNFSFNDSSLGAPNYARPVSVSAVTKKKIYKSGANDANLDLQRFAKICNACELQSKLHTLTPFSCVRKRTEYAKQRFANPVFNSLPRIPQRGKGYEVSGVMGQQLRDQKQKDLSYILKEESVAKELETEGYAKRKCHVRVWGIKLKVKDKTPQGNIIYKYKVAKHWHNLYFAIAQSKNSLKICENKNSSYNIQRLSIENIGNYSQLNNNNFQLINSLQFSHLQRDRFYPNWFRLYLPDMEATEFLKNITNYYFSLGLQTLTFPSTKFSRACVAEGMQSKALGKPKVSTASPFLTFLNKNTQKDKLFIPNISSYTYCPPSILINSTSTKSINSRNKLTSCAKQDKWYVPQKNTIWLPITPYPGYTKLSFAKGMQSKARDIQDPSFTKVAKDQLDPLNVPFSLLLERQIFPLNYNGFSIVEKELLYNALVNSSFAKAFYLINQNRQLLDFFVDYLLRFQILRQHQILYLFSTLLLSCNKTA